jgi:hypothetical protein
MEAVMVHELHEWATRDAAGYVFDDSVEDTATQVNETSEATDSDGDDDGDF